MKGAILSIHNTENLRPRIRCLSVTLVALLAVFLVGCGGVGEVATVEGEPITFDEVAVLIPGDEDTVDTEQFAGTLMLVVADRVMTIEAAEQFGVSRTEGEIDEKIGELVAFTGLSQEEIFEYYGLTADSLRIIAAQEVTADQVKSVLDADAGAPSEEALRSLYAEMSADLSEVCASHILVETEAEAVAALDRAAAEDFAALAMELSTGPSGPNGGDLGCAAPNSYVPEFADATLSAEVGVPFGPVETTYGWHVILVSDRSVATFEETRGTLEQDIMASESNQRWTEWLTGVLAEADVSIDPEYGTWTTDPVPNILPPSS